MSQPTPSERPRESEYAPFYAGYVAQVPEADVLAVLEGQPDVIRRVAASVTAEREGFRYAPGKWSVREVFGHMADAERLFTYRVLSIARGNAVELPGFDENGSMERAGFDDRPLASLTDELLAVRAATLPLFRHLEPQAWQRTGTANGHPVSVRALAYITAGHVRHHLEILRERYSVG